MILIDPSSVGDPVHTLIICGICIVVIIVLIIIISKKSYI